MAHTLFGRGGSWVARLLLVVASPLLFAGDLDFSDPARVPAPPPGAVGYPDRSADLDVLPGFRKPPAGYGEVAFYWWLGDPLTKERLTWQMDQLAGKGVMGLQINYAHSDRGGRSYGLSFPSDPPVFSEPWWELVRWFVKEARSRGMAVSLSDYTLGIGQGFIMDEIIREDSALCGSTLAPVGKDVEGGREVQWEAPEGVIGITAYRQVGGKFDGGSAVDLRPMLNGRTLRWNAPAGQWHVIAVSARANPWSVDPLNPQTGRKYTDKFFGRFTDRNPGEGGKGLNFFFSDELEFGIRGNLWTPRFADEFKKRKGYDIVPELPALFAEIGPRTAKVRLDYRDVMVSLSEEGFFKPVFDWHHNNGMIYGCDHGGRGRDVAEFGDYFRTQRWNGGPGCDQPGLGRDVIKNKVASSISHLYLRPRTWLEGYYGSGWGTTPAGVADATFANFAMGQNLLTFHGLYYATHGGWWEWAPPCNHFRMPYWAHMGEFLKCVERLSYVLSQGHHRCDVAVLYPVAPSEAGLGGREAVDAAFSVGNELYARGVDFDFIDFESLARAQVKEGKLCVSGEEYRVLVLPAMRAVRYSTMQKAAEFVRGKGMVAAVRSLPEASDRAGADDAELDALVKDIFGTTAKETKVIGVAQVRKTNGGTSILAGGAGPIIAEMDKAFPRDFAIAGDKTPQIMHRREGSREVYFVYGAPQGSECTFRAKGRVELWNPWNGDTRELAAVSQSADTTKLRMPLGETEPQLIVFSPGTAKIENEAPAAVKPAEITLDGNWEFELKPTMDNRFGDYRWPAFAGFIGAEARQFRYADETRANPGWERPDFDDGKWIKVTQAFGPKFWKLGPLPDNVDAASLEAQLSALDRVDPAAPVDVGGKKYPWRPYSFSWRWGIEGDPGHQGYHGLKEEMSDEFIGLGKLQQSGTGTSYVREPEGSRYYLFTSVAAPAEMPARLAVGGAKPAGIWINHAKLKSSSGPTKLNAGSNPLLARFDGPGRSFIVVGEAGKIGGSDDDGQVFSADTKYIWYPNDKATADRFFRRSFDLKDRPPKTTLRVTCDNAYTLYVNGAEIGSGSQWERVQQYDVAAKLRPGKNVLAVRGHNDGADAGLIVELRTGSTPLVATDSAWRCAEKQEPRWLDAGFDDSNWTRAEVISNFADSLWFKHQHGPPHLEAAPPAVAPERIGSLAMSWFNNPGVLPFDTRSGEASPAGWYRFTAAPGLKAMTLVARGKVRAWADGVELKVAPCDLEPARRTDLKATAYRAELPQAAAGSARIALRIEQDRGCYGGAALPEPILLDCGKGTIATGDWSQIDGLACYSGGAWYRRTLTLTAAQAAGRVELDLGKVAGSVEVHINGKPAGIRVAPPWRIELTGLVKPGENRVEVLVYNTLANHYTTIPTRYRGSPVSGLLGPVMIRVGL